MFSHPSEFHLWSGKGGGLPTFPYLYATSWMVHQILLAVLCPPYIVGLYFLNFSFSTPVHYSLQSPFALFALKPLAFLFSHLLYHSHHHLFVLLPHLTFPHFIVYILSSPLSPPFSVINSTAYSLRVILHSPCLSSLL